MLTEKAIVEAIKQGKTVSYGSNYGCDRDHVELNVNNKPYWARTRSLVKSLDYHGLVIEN